MGMPYEQAHQVLEDKQREMTKNRGLYAVDDISANGKAIEAVEKQIPKQVKPYAISSTWVQCPTCGATSYLDEYCAHCGQRLDWTRTGREVEDEK